eukprot:2125407-Prymnesium_polylepis.1
MVVHSFAVCPRSGAPAGTTQSRFDAPHTRCIAEPTTATWLGTAVSAEHHTEMAELRAGSQRGCVVGDDDDNHLIMYFIDSYSPLLLQCALL